MQLAPTVDLGVPATVAGRLVLADLPPGEPLLGRAAAARPRGGRDHDRPALSRRSRLALAVRWPLAAPVPGGSLLPVARTHTLVVVRSLLPVSPVGAGPAPAAVPGVAGPAGDQSSGGR